MVSIDNRALPHRRVTDPTNRRPTLTTIKEDRMSQAPTPESLRERVSRSHAAHEAIIIDRIARDVTDADLRAKAAELHDTIVQVPNGHAKAAELNDIAVQVPNGHAQAAAHTPAVGPAAPQAEAPRHEKSPRSSRGPKQPER